MPARFSGESCERCSRPGHNPPAVRMGMCVNCLRSCAPIERAVAELTEQGRVASEVERFEREALAEIERLTGA